MIRLLLTLTVLAGLSGATAVRAEEHPGPPHHRRGPPPIDDVLERHAERLGLSDEVREQIRVIGAASRERSEETREEMHELRQGMRELLDQEQPDEAAVMEQAELIGWARTAAHKERLATMLRIRALLTPEQRRTLVEIHQERRERRRSRHGLPEER